MISGAREGSPPVIARATACDCCCELQVIATAVADAVTTTAPRIGQPYLESADGIAAPFRFARVPDPEGGQDQRRTGIDRARRYPHDDPGELLIFQRRQSPCCGRAGLWRIEQAWRQRHQCPQHAGMQHGDKEMPRCQPGITPSKHRPPEYHRSEEETEML